MSGFAELMALSATNTRAAQDALQAQLVERKKREQLQRKKQEEKESKEREIQKLMRQRHFEEQQREAERQAKREQEMKAREAEQLRKDEEQRDALRYGPKKAREMHSDSGGSKQQQARRRHSPDIDVPETFTREELRQRKQQAMERRLFGASKRTSTNQGRAYGKHGRRLPGGAIDMMTPASSSSSQEAGSTNISVRQRLAAMPNTLTKLNVNKRDTRTTAEVIEATQKARASKVLDGDQAKEFSDWFTSKKKPAVKPPVSSGSGQSTPVSRSTKSPVESMPARTTTPTSRPSAASSSAFSKSIPKSSTAPASSSIKRPGARASSTDRTPAPKPSKPASSSAKAKKRSRSPSYFSDSPPPSKKRSRAIDDGGEDISSVIWGLFGKKKDEYTSRDVFSDDEDDMEVDARAVEREEQVSARHARKEEAEAMEAERLHEEEKARRRKERERLTRA